MILLKLKFYTWLVDFYKHFAYSSSSYNLLTQKDYNNLFSFTIEAEVNENLPNGDF
jgi:hypothetical protein